MMMDGINKRPCKRLIINIFSVFLAAFFLFFAVHGQAQAEDQPPAVPVIAVEAETLAPPVIAPSAGPEAPVMPPESGSQTASPASADAPVVVELFSSQACSFCPKADALLGELAHAPDIIALSCHVDYFDVKTGSLSHPFCSARQVGYESTLRAGPKYTPQMVVNGHYDVVGYRRADVLTTIRRARKDQGMAVPVLKTEGSSVFSVSLPGLDTGVPAASEHAEQAPYEIYVLAMDRPHTVTVAEGANAGKSIVYTNVVRNVGLLGSWDGGAKTLRFDPKMTEDSLGFAVLVSRTADGHIVAAAQYTKPKPAPVQNTGAP